MNEVAPPQRRVAIAAPDLGGREAEYLQECVASGWISSKGRFVEAFERDFAAWIGTRFGTTVCNGTVALHLALAALRVGRGDEVVIPTFTMIACANSVVYQGARPVLVDSEPNSWNLDPARLEAAITDRTKAIMVVHLYGHPCDMDPILEIARRRSIPVVEDAAQAHGAEYHGTKVGGLGEIGAFSFYANKILTTGEGGMVVTNDPELHRRASSLRDQAYDQSRRAWLVHEEIGYNYRLTNLQAAVGLAQLERVDQFVERHRSIARQYNELLRDVPGIQRPPAEAGTRDVYWMYTVLIDPAEFGRPRDDVITALRARGIDSRSTFFPIHQQPAYRAMFPGAQFPVAERLARDGINLPSGNSTTPDDVRYVAAALAELSRR